MQEALQRAPTSDLMGAVVQRVRFHLALQQGEVAGLLVAGLVVWRQLHGLLAGIVGVH